MGATLTMVFRLWFKDSLNSENVEIFDPTGSFLNLLSLKISLRRVSENISNDIDLVSITWDFYAEI